jgi:hypothetical protein
VKTINDMGALERFKTSI